MRILRPKPNEGKQGNVPGSPAHGKCATFTQNDNTHPAIARLVGEIIAGRNQSTIDSGSERKLAAIRLQPSRIVEHNLRAGLGRLDSRAHLLNLRGLMFDHRI